MATLFQNTGQNYVVSRLNEPLLNASKDGYLKQNLWHPALFGLSSFSFNDPLKFTGRFLLRRLVLYFFGKILRLLLYTTSPLNLGQL